MRFIIILSILSLSTYGQKCEHVSELLDLKAINEIKLVREDICLSLHLGKNINYDLQEIESNMNKCITAVFSNSPIDLKVKLNCNSKATISRKWEQETQFGLFDPLLTSTGENHAYNKKGHLSNSFHFFVSNKVKRSNAKSYWPASVPLQEKLDAIKAGEIDRECKKFYDEVVNPYQQSTPESLGITDKEHEKRKMILFKRSSNICEPGYLLQDKYPDTNLPSGNCAHIRPKDDSKSLSETLVHELMHLYAGFADRYGGSPESRKKWEDNLMGLNSKCNPLEDDQIRALIKYRYNGTSEDF